MIANKLKELRKKKGLTLEELASTLGTSKQTIHRYENGVISNIPPEKVELLAGALSTTPAELMGWSATVQKPQGFQGANSLTLKSLPIIGEIACGEPIFAVEEHERFAAVSAELDANFCLKAHGDSMTGARIYDGDIVFIRAQSWVENGEIAAVIINDEATLKRFYYYPDEEKLVLSPENPKYAPLLYVKEELESVRIIGKAVAFQSQVM